MKQLRINIDPHGPPGLLVSVRNELEARTALESGADLIDVKEPNRGALGAADYDAIQSIVRVVNRQAPVSAALGELTDYMRNNPKGRINLPRGVALFKLGLAGCNQIQDWQSHWHSVLMSVCALGNGENIQPVAVAYADWRAAQAPSPDQVLEAAINVGCPALLVDTYHKSGGNLFDYWPVAELAEYVARVREHRMISVLAGSLSGDAFEKAIALSPDLVAVRGAACEAGRNGTISAERVAHLKSTINRLANHGDRIVPIAR